MKKLLGLLLITIVFFGCLETTSPEEKNTNLGTPKIEQNLDGTSILTNEETSFYIKATPGSADKVNVSVQATFNKEVGSSQSSLKNTILASMSDSNNSNNYESNTIQFSSENTNCVFRVFSKETVKMIDAKEEENSILFSGSQDYDVIFTIDDFVDNINQANDQTTSEINNSDGVDMEGSFISNVPGNLDVKITAKDNNGVDYGEEAVKTATVTVGEDLAVISLEISIVEDQEWENGSFPIGFEFLDNDINSIYKYMQINIYDGNGTLTDYSVTLEKGTSRQISFDDCGTYTVEYYGIATISENAGEVGTAYITIPNSLPVVKYNNIGSNLKTGIEYSINLDESYDVDGSCTKFGVDWGDGTLDLSTNTTTFTHIYKKTIEDCTIKLKVYDDGEVGSNYSEVLLSVSVSSSQKISPYFDMSVVIDGKAYTNTEISSQEIHAGDLLSLDASASLASEEAEIESYKWEVYWENDWHTIATKNAGNSFTYKLNWIGNAVVRLTIKDSNDKEASYERVVFVTNRPPTASLMASKISGYAPLTVQFTWSNYDPDGLIKKLGSDDEYLDRCRVFVSNSGVNWTQVLDGFQIHEFEYSGNKPYYLKVEDCYGGVAYDTLEIEVKIPTTSFEVENTDESYTENSLALVGDNLNFILNIGEPSYVKKVTFYRTDNLSSIVKTKLFELENTEYNFEKENVISWETNYSNIDGYQIYAEVMFENEEISTLNFPIYVDVLNMDILSNLSPSYSTSIPSNIEFSPSITEGDLSSSYEIKWSCDWNGETYITSTASAKASFSAPVYTKEFTTLYNGYSDNETFNTLKKTIAQYSGLTVTTTVFYGYNVYKTTETGLASITPVYPIGSYSSVDITPIQEKTLTVTAKILKNSEIIKTFTKTINLKVAGGTKKTTIKNYCTTSYIQTGVHSVNSRFKIYDLSKKCFTVGRNQAYTKYYIKEN